MEKSRKVRAASCTLAAALALGTAAGLLSACKGKNKRDNETTPLTIASDLFDGVFNPFFYTSGVDGEVVGQTQVGMLSSNENGMPTAGMDEPCVAQAYSVVTTGSRELQTSPDDFTNYYTDYYFAIKDGLTFSDGHPLTINDVLFNIYMYLDPAYTGSATMYSVDIQGLPAYRTQTLSEKEQENFESAMSSDVKTRIDTLAEWATNRQQGDFSKLSDTAKSDISRLETLFREELNSDWTAAMNVDLKDYEKYHFTENWHVFLYSYGVITVRSIRDAQNNLTYETDFDNVPNNVEKTQEGLVNYVFDFMFGGKQNATTAYKNNLIDVLYYSATASNFRSALLSEAMRNAVTDPVTGEVDLLVRTVSGITTSRASTIPSSDGGTIDLGGDRDILRIRINGEDPKAIQNFGFAVAPMHYYSPIADQFTLESDKENFGVSWSDIDFMNEIRVKQVPLGAGPYRVSTRNGAAADATVEKGDFYENNTVYFERNESFMLGAPKIKYLRYQVASQSSLYNTVKTGGIDYATPTATNQMMRDLNGTDSKVLDYTITDNLGYGYIGINAAYVKDLEIRKAIMSALDPSLALAYYGSSDLASIIYRPMSRTLKDYYPTAATSYYPFDESGKTALAYAQMAGYYPDSSKGGLLTNSSGETLHFTFTVAGDSVDHPAYNTMVRAASILNDNGFDITVTTDSTALIKLASGRLEVWAAAWSSSSDPDMYQVYHKDSTATSILNWGFPTIEREGSDNEKKLLETLAAKIEEGRQTTDVSQRQSAYSISTSGPLYSVSNDGDEVTITQNSSAKMDNLCALDLVMELAVEFPLYQRSALFVYQRGIFDEATLALFDESSAFQSPLSKIWLVSFA